MGHLPLACYFAKCGSLTTKEKEFSEVRSVIVIFYKRRTEYVISIFSGIQDAQQLAGLTV